MIWGARSNRRWTVPVAGMLALPALWYGGLTMLLAVIALRDPDRNQGFDPRLAIRLEAERDGLTA